MSTEILVGKLSDNDFSITIKLSLPNGRYTFLENDSLLETKEKFFEFKDRKIYILKYPDYNIFIRHSYFWGHSTFELIKNKEVVCRYIDLRNIKYSLLNTLFYLINISISFLISFSLLKLTKTLLFPYMIFFGSFTVVFFFLIKLFGKLSKKIYKNKFLDIPTNCDLCG